MGEAISLTAAIRQCADEIKGYVDAHNGDPTPKRNQVLDSIRRLLARPDLYDAGMHVPSRNQGTNRILYFDPKLMIAMGDFQKGRHDTPHDHGVWLATGVYTGEMDYLDYRRVDESRPGHARLELTDHRVLKAGDVGLALAPPNDIHENIGLTECYSMIVCGGKLAPARTYFNMAKGTYGPSPD